MHDFLEDVSQNLHRRLGGIDIDDAPLEVLEDGLRLVFVGLEAGPDDLVVQVVEPVLLESSKADTPLPVIGVFGSVALGDKTDLGASIEIFRMEFDTYDGSLNAFHLNVTHYFTERIGAGVGYNYFSMDLDSPDVGLRGSTQIRHHGPIVFATFTF